MRSVLPKSGPVCRRLSARGGSSPLSGRDFDGSAPKPRHSGGGRVLESPAPVRYVREFARRFTDCLGAPIRLSVVETGWFVLSVAVLAFLCGMAVGAW